MARSWPNTSCRSCWTSCWHTSTSLWTAAPKCWTSTIRTSWRKEWMASAWSCQNNRTTSSSCWLTAGTRWNMELKQVYTPAVHNAKPLFHRFYTALSTLVQRSCPDLPFLFLTSRSPTILQPALNWTGHHWTGRRMAHINCEHKHVRF